MHLAPEGFRVRLMEPGEAEALLAIGVSAGLFQGPAPATAEFVPWLLRHEIFVAETLSGEPAGFAAARDAIDLYWASALAVDPAFKERGLRKALLAAVVTRAGWFFHRAVGLCARGEADADWYRRRRFLGVERDDWTPELASLAEERPGLASLSSDGAEDRSLRHDLVGSERTIMIHWL